jgi:murein L,D-transpeptidase YafK
MIFWQQLKAGYDKFNDTRRELRVSVADKKYVID